MSSCWSKIVSAFVGRALSYLLDQHMGFLGAVCLQHNRVVDEVAARI